MKINDEIPDHYKGIQKWLQESEFIMKRFKGEIG